VLRWLAGQIFRSLAQKQFADAMTSARRPVQTPSEAPEFAEQSPSTTDSDSHILALICHKREELTGIVDRMSRIVVTQAAGFTVRTGKLSGQRVVAVVTNSDANATARATNAVITAHGPQLVAAVGFATALAENVKRGDVIVANRIVGRESTGVRIEFTAVPRQSRVHFGTLVTSADLPDTPQVRREVGRTFGAIASDQHAFDVADVCRREQVPMMAVHVITKEVDDGLPADIGHLFKQKSLAGRVGALLGSIVRRPRAAQDLWHLKQTTWQASDRLAGFLAALLSR
jgi:nucleoside phosphorylase